MPEPSQITLPRAILFDHDGVLVQSEPLHWRAWKELLRELGLPYVESEIRSRVGFTAPQILSQILDKYRPEWNPTLIDIHALAQQKNDLYLAVAQKELRTYPGVVELLQWLKKKGIPCAVVSNAKRRELVTALQWVGIHDLFDTIVSRDDAGTPKPDPAPYLLAAATLGLQVEECLAVEDSPAGIEAALMGKIPAAAVLTHFSRAVMQSPVLGRPDLKPIWVGDSIVDLFEYLRAL